MIIYNIADPTTEIIFNLSGVSYEYRRLPAPDTSYILGEWDIGLSHFYGTGREPTLIPKLNSSGQLRLIPYYQVIHQTGVDIHLGRDKQGYV